MCVPGVRDRRQFPLRRTFERHVRVLRWEFGVILAFLPTPCTYTSSTTIAPQHSSRFPQVPRHKVNNHSPCTSECLRRYHPNRKPVPRVGVRQRSPRELLAASSGELDAETGPGNVRQQPRGLRSYRGHFCIRH